MIYIFTHIGCFGFEPSHARPFLFVDLWQILVRWGARRYRRAVPVPGHSGAAVLFGPTVCLNAVLPTPHTYTDVFCLFPSGLGSWVSGPGSSGLLGPFPGPVPCLSWVLIMTVNCAIKMPTPCLWQAPASTQKTKRKTMAERFYCFSKTITSFRRFLLFY